MILEFLPTYKLELILGLSGIVFLQAIWLGYKFYSPRNPISCSDTQELRNFALKIQFKIEENGRNGYEPPKEEIPNISVELIEMDIERVDLEATIASYWSEKDNV